MPQVQSLLDQVIENKVNNDLKHRSSSSGVRDGDVTRLEEILDIVWSQSEYTPWEVLIQTTLCLSENSLPDMFCKIIEYMGASKINVYHVFTLYALFVDNVSSRIRNIFL